MAENQTAPAADTAPVVTPLTATTPVLLVKQPFHFKTETLRNEKGEEVGKGKKHPSVSLDLPLPTIVTLKSYLDDTSKYAKELELIFGAMLDQTYRVARSQINDWRENNKDGTVTAASLNYDKLDWSAIAAMPPKERTSSIPGDDDIKSFLESYLAIMPTALNKDKSKIENHIVCFQTGFKKQRSQKDILEVFANALNVYLTAAGDELVEEHMEVLEYFQGRLAKLMKSEEKITLDAI